jgi:AcrR family transcriptional regulator
MANITTEPRVTKRSLNMAKRRSLILSHTRSILAQEGFDALKIRDLAERAGVTVPTIYNLIGGKTEILKLIIEDLVKHLQSVQSPYEVENVEAAFEAQIDQLAALFGTNKDYYRAAFLAGDRSGLFEQTTEEGIFSRSVRVPIEACLEAQETGLLLGKISAHTLGRQIYGSYRLARQDWVNGYFDLAAFRVQALTGVFLCLAADASPAFRKRLIKRISNLT